jgi:hypothetical protein
MKMAIIAAGATLGILLGIGGYIVSKGGPQSAPQAVPPAQAQAAAEPHRPRSFRSRSGPVRDGAAPAKPWRTTWTRARPKLRWTPSDSFRRAR